MSKKTAAPGPQAAGVAETSGADASGAQAGADASGGQDGPAIEAVAGLVVGLLPGLDRRDSGPGNPAAAARALTTGRRRAAGLGPAYLKHCQTYP